MSARSDTEPAVSVVVHGHAGPDDLQRCLAALIPSLRHADEALVLLDRDDALSQRVVDTFARSAAPIRVLGTASEGQGAWAALLTGVSVTGKPVVAFLEGAALPMPGWTEAISAGFRDPSVGGFGGLVLKFDDIRTGNRFYTAGPVARMDYRGVLHSRMADWVAGRIVEEADSLPVANMAFRREVLRRLACVNADIPEATIGMLCACAARAEGQRVVFDSAVRVEHHTRSHRTETEHDAVRHAYGYGYMLALVLREAPRLAHLWPSLIGSRAVPGILTAPLCMAKGKTGLARWRAARQGWRSGRSAHRHSLLGGGEI